MRTLYLAVLALPLALGGCLSFSSTEPAPASRTIIVPQSTSTAVVPPGTTTVVCTTGLAPPC